MKHKFKIALLTIAFLGVVFVPKTHAETTTTSVAVQIEQIKVLMAKLEELQKQLATLKGEVRETLKSGLTEGTSDEDIKKVQELLATDSTIYPEGKVTGYFGPLTKEAIKRFQKRHELDESGVLDTDTKALLEEYLAERKNGHIPPGLLHAPEIMKKVEDRFKEDHETTTESVPHKKHKTITEPVIDEEHETSTEPVMHEIHRPDDEGMEDTDA